MMSTGTTLMISDILICKSEAPAEEAINEGDTRTPEQIIADICAQLKKKA